MIDPANIHVFLPNYSSGVVKQGSVLFCYRQQKNTITIEICATTHDQETDTSIPHDLSIFFSYPLSLCASIYVRKQDTRNVLKKKIQ
jgi:hypothetical protein